MSFTVSAWAKGTHRTTGAAQAVRVQILQEKYDVNEEYGLRSNAAGIYRVTYGSWAEETGSTATDENGNRQRYIPPSKLNSDGDDYTVPEEAVEAVEGLEPPPD